MHIYVLWSSATNAFRRHWQFHNCKVVLSSNIGEWHEIALLYCARGPEDEVVSSVPLMVM